MSDKIFFSYSRHDSAFALKLASDLRNAGATIWLDQLDIPPGKHWDSEIEEALQNANCLLAILSPKSMLSNNAMDEISYALEENKKVIPILLTSTETPFRLRRLQRVDFTGEYNTAFRQLLSAVDIEKIPPAKVPLKQPDKPASSGDTLSKTLTEKRELEQQEVSLWAKARSTNTIEAYKDYLKQTSSHENLDEAGYRIKKLETGAQTPQKTGAFKAGEKASKRKTKKYFLVAFILVTLVAVGGAAFRMITNETGIKNIGEKVAQAPQTVIEKKDSLKQKKNDTIAKVTVLQKSAPDNIELTKDESNRTAKAEVLKEKSRKPPPEDKHHTIINPDSNISPPKKNDFKKDAETISLTSSPPVEKPTSSEKVIHINSNVEVGLKLMDGPDMGKRRETQAIKFSVTQNIVIDGITIIRDGSVVNGSMKVGVMFISLKIDQVVGTNGKIIPLVSKESDLKRREVKKDNTYYATIKKGTTLFFD